MFRPQIQKTRVLFLIALFNLSMVYFAANSYTKVKQIGYNDKIKAVDNMSMCLQSIKKHPNYNDNSDDIFNTGLLGVQTSLITTKEDVNLTKKQSKIACTNPNFSAAIIEMFYESGIQGGDHIAVSMTGSFPGANIALLSACKAMNIKPFIISSGGSSAWGANRPDFSWPIIESYLYENQMIDYKSLAYSIGGANDLGDNLSYKGVQLLSNTIFDVLDKKTEFVNEENLSKNIERKVQIYKTDLKISDYSLYVNIGGGSASLGYGEQKDTMNVGFISPLDIEFNQSEEFRNSIAYEFLNEGVPMLNIKNINKLGSQYGLYPPSKDLEIKEGVIFIKYVRYNLFVIIIGLICSISLILFIGIYSHLQIKRRMEGHEPESIM